MKPTQTYKIRKTESSCARTGSWQAGNRVLRHQKPNQIIVYRGEGPRAAGQQLESNRAGAGLTFFKKIKMKNVIYFIML